MGPLASHAVYDLLEPVQLLTAKAVTQCEAYFTLSHDDQDDSVEWI